MKVRLGVLLLVVAAGCSAPVADVAGRATPEPPPHPKKERHVRVRDAVARLAAHVDVPVVLPRDRLAGVRNLDRWVADLRYLDRRRHRGNRIGTLVVRKGKEILWIHYGHAAPDGCGGRDTAVETEVAGHPALVWTTRGREWSQIVWPVRRRGHTGRYGLSGTFEPWEIVRLAESMEVRRGRAPRDDGC